MTVWIIRTIIQVKGGVNFKNMKNIGNRIKFIREQRGITQEGLADKIGIERSQISKIENNISRGSLPTLSKIANALELKIGDLLEEVEN